MRRAFTLIELLVVVAIIGAMTATAVISVRAGQDGARIKGSVRDAFATIRLARSMALVSKQPSVITYSTVTEDDECCARIAIHIAKPFSSSRVTRATTLAGDQVSVDGEDDGSDPKRSSVGGTEGEPLLKDGEGKSTEEFLFEEADSEVYRGIALKVIKEGDELADFGEERAKPKISVFSNVDFLLGKFKESQAKKTAEESPAENRSSDSAAPSTDGQEAVSFVWEVNGRTEPHKVWFYRAGTRYDEGLCISVDRFGAAKVLSEDDD